MHKPLPDRAKVVVVGAGVEGRATGLRSKADVEDVALRLEHGHLHLDAKDWSPEVKCSFPLAFEEASPAPDAVERQRARSNVSTGPARIRLNNSCQDDDALKMGEKLKRRPVKARRNCAAVRMDRAKKYDRVGHRQAPWSSKTLERPNLARR